MYQHLSIKIKKINKKTHNILKPFSPSFTPIWNQFLVPLELWLFHLHPYARSSSAVVLSVFCELLFSLPTGCTVLKQTAITASWKRGASHTDCKLVYGAFAGHEPSCPCTCQGHAHNGGKKHKHCNLGLADGTSWDFMGISWQGTPIAHCSQDLPKLNTQLTPVLVLYLCNNMQ